VVKSVANIMEQPAKRTLRPLESAQDEEHIWSFRLKANAALDPEANPDPLVEMVRVFLADFLEIGFLTKDGARVDADGFAFVAEPGTLHEIFPSKDVL